jgi:carotenoid cleavage dioxygenase
MFFVARTSFAQVPPMIGLNHVSKEGVLQKSLAAPVLDAAGTSPAFVHDFWLTEHFAIFFDASLRSDGRQVSKGGKFFFWQAKDNLRFGVLPRDADSFEDDIIWCDTGSPGFIWHVINGWETTTVNKDGVVSISLFSPKFSEYSATIPIHTPEEPPSRLTRWDLKLNLATKDCISVTEVQMRDEIVERPSTNLRFHGSPLAKWAFLRSEGSEASAVMGGTILKVNLKTGELAATFNCENNEPCVTGEALFVPKNTEYTKVYPFAGPVGVSEAEEEDEGFLLDMVYYPERNTSELVVWDAAAAGSAFPIARVALPERVPHGVHAWFVPPYLHSSSF